MKIFLKKSQDLLKSNLVFQDHEDFFIKKFFFFFFLDSSSVVDNPHIPVETENQTAVSSSFFVSSFLSSLNTGFSKQRSGVGKSPPLGRNLNFLLGGGTLRRSEFDHSNFFRS